MMEKHVFKKSVYVCSLVKDRGNFGVFLGGILGKIGILKFLAFTVIFHGAGCFPVLSLPVLIKYVLFYMFE